MGMSTHCITAHLLAISGYVQPTRSFYNKMSGYPPRRTGSATADAVRQQEIGAMVFAPVGSFRKAARRCCVCSPACAGGVPTAEMRTPLLWSGSKLAHIRD
jgi:hypothetical protein